MGPARRPADVAFEAAVEADSRAPSGEPSSRLPASATDLRLLHPRQRQDTVLAMQRTQGNAAVAQMLQRDAPAAPAPSAPPSLGMRLDGLRDGLRREGAAPMWSLLDGKLTLDLPRPIPRLLPEAGPAAPGQMAFGPLSNDDALKALTHAKQKPDWLERALRPRPERESALDFYVVYENDGSGIIPNFGSGSDQGRTAALYLYANFNKHGLGLSRIGLTAMEMTTPRGTLPAGAPGGPASTYETPPGPYGGVAAIDVGITVARSGTSKLDFLVAAGIDSREWGELVQDFIHEKISNSPVFPWPSGTKPLVEGGLHINKTIPDLTRESFAGLSYTGRLELDASVITGSRKSEATAGARFVIRTAKVHTPAGAVSVEFSPLGAFARGFVRYNDGREAPIAGAEGGVNSSVMLNVGHLGIGLRGEGVVSTDPAFQTGLPAGAHPTALEASPVVGEGFGLPAGAHGTGQVILKFEF